MSTLGYKCPGLNRDLRSLCFVADDQSQRFPAIALAQILAQQRSLAWPILVPNSATRQTYTRVAKITCRASTFSGILSPRIILPCKIAYGFDAINNVTR